MRVNLRARACGRMYTHVRLEHPIQHFGGTVSTKYCSRAHLPDRLLCLNNGFQVQRTSVTAQHQMTRNTRNVIVAKGSCVEGVNSNGHGNKRREVSPGRHILQVETQSATRALLTSRDGRCRPPATPRRSASPTVIIISLMLYV